jgi:hypothetical protein
MTCPVQSATNQSPRSAMATLDSAGTASPTPSSGLALPVFRSRRAGGKLPTLQLTPAMRIGQPGTRELVCRVFHGKHLAARQRALGMTIRYLEETLGKRSRSKALSLARADLADVVRQLLAMGER